MVGTYSVFGLITDDGILLAAYIKQKKAEASVAIIMPSSNQSPYRIVGIFHAGNVSFFSFSKR